MWIAVSDGALAQSPPSGEARLKELSITLWPVITFALIALVIALYSAASAQSARHRTMAL
jgi:hypothetical protein